MKVPDRTKWSLGLTRKNWLATHLGIKIALHYNAWHILPSAVLYCIVHYTSLHCIALYCVVAYLYVYLHMVLLHGVYVVTKLQMLTNAPRDSTTVTQTLTQDAVALKVRSNVSARQGTPEMA